MIVLTVKDIVLYPFLKGSYDTNVKTGVEQLIGQTAVVQHDLNPEGLVLIRGELWRARVWNCEQTVSTGSAVRVQSGEGLTLIVSPAGVPPRCSDNSVHRLQ